MLHKGWIAAKITDCKLLKSLGIILGTYDRENSTWENCLFSSESLTKLDQYWGTFYWRVDEDEVAE